MLLPTCNLCRHWMGASTSDMAVEHPWESFADQQTAAVNTGTWHHMAICAWGNAPNSCSQSHVTYQDLAKPNPQKWTIPTNTSNLYSQIRYDLPRKKFKHIDQNPIPLAPFSCGFLLYASPDQGHLLAKTCVFPCKGGYSTDAQERRKLLNLSPLWGKPAEHGKHV